MADVAEVPTRDELPKSRTWNAESVFPDQQAWEQAASEVEKAAEEIRGWRGGLGESPAALLEALRARDELIREADTVMVYAGMAHYCDTRDPRASVMHSRAQSLDAKAKSAVAFFEPEILAIGKGRIEEWLDREPELAVYRPHLMDLFRRAEHVRSDEVEELLGLVQAPFNSVAGTAQVLVNADFEFEPAEDETGQTHKLTQGTRTKLLRSPDRTLRQSAWSNYEKLYSEHRRTLANNLVTSIKQNVFMTQSRRHEGTLEAALFEDNIPTEVFHNLLEIYERRLPIWHRYFELRRRLLDVEELQPYDIWAPLVAERPDLSYETAVEWICEGLAPMGENYVQTVRNGCLEDRWVDPYPNKGKRAGAFSYGTKGTPPFIVMNFTGSVLNLSTLAHELGHSMHSYYAWREQPMVYCDYSLFAAEVASNFHQALVRAHLLEEREDRTLQVMLLEEAFSNFNRYLLEMPTLARFELELHERVARGEGLSADDMIELCTELFSKAYGEAMHVEAENIGMRWAHFTHLYRDYYVFQYATGISAAHALAERVLSKEEGAAGDYLDFLRAGDSVYAIEALRTAGVDMTQPGPIETAFDTLDGMVDRLEELLV